ncbi:TetR family transcriptional regulator [Microbacterium caowuchunii]|uniref:TetR/AcrR family transcriptional regulator n=1 Tax=Microbacterium caowuchunii TaxID=2614638 RepID=UPI001245F54F|nr:TetR/AcrR family transcriptional regulator [Microbacterium caowuchunii]QEV99828.1 TetR family transcriptional regulator [Microbacterium caowuchunii]
MSASARPGRPRASSRETIAEAASELFLEQGYDATSIADITRRAGVSRSSFFNYFAGKVDVLWTRFDERIRVAEDLLRTPEVTVRDALSALADGLVPDTLALAITNAEAMGVAAELARDRALRQARLQNAVAERLRAEGTSSLESEVRGAAYAAAVLAAVWAWADRTGDDTSLEGVLADALELAAR